MKTIILILVGVFIVSGGIYAGTALVSDLRSGSEGTISMPPAPEPPQTPPAFAASSTEVRSTAPEPVGASLKDIQLICGGAASSDFDCYEKHYANLVKTKGITAAFADLKARYFADSYVKAQCHPLTHVIGRYAAKKFDTVGEAYTKGDSFCWSGYYHGVLETFIDEIGLKNLPAQMDNVCANIKGKERYSFDYYNCVHGLGHGVMAATQTELFQSLDLCDNLTGAWEQLSCASGAFMENVIVDGLNHKTKYLDPKRPLYPCDESGEKYKNTCYLMQTSYMLKINGGDFKKTFEWCRNAGEQYAPTCWQSLGRDASGRSASDVERTKATCLLGESYDEQSNCVMGAVKDFISYFHSDAQAKAFCNAFEDKRLTGVCLSVGGTYYQLF